MNRAERLHEVFCMKYSEVDALHSAHVEHAKQIVARNEAIREVF